VKKILFKWLPRLAVALVVLLALVGIGRLAQVYAQSQYHGERAPYVQMLGHDSVTLRWQTRGRDLGVVRFGEQPDRLDNRAEQSGNREEHEVRLTGLKPSTRYWYVVGNDKRLLRGADGEHWFVTAPQPGSKQATRIWVLGDPGYVSEMVEGVKEAGLEWMQAHPRRDRPPLDLILTTGDNAYKSGKNREFQKAVFEMFGDLINKYPYWPAYGNHDARRWAFFNIFTFPENGELGGVASGSENYFSFDYANIHFVFLDSEKSSRERNGEMLTWLRKDLAATSQQWLIAVFHHPPYTKGGHDSDSLRDSRGRMTDMRENALPILEAAGVDLVLSGHSHTYERSHLLDCHYGFSDSLQPSMVLDRDKLFEKRSSGLAPHEGTVYAVVGGSSHLDGGPLDHPVMALSASELGSLVIDVEGDRLDAYYVNQLGEEREHFSITKGVAGAKVGSCDK
jgi:3',5'-cyclic AMP phosphodiesterase CpdA